MNEAGRELVCVEARRAPWRRRADEHRAGGAQMSTVQRECPDEETRALFELTRELADKELRPKADGAERDEMFPRDTFRILGRSGLLALPYPERLGRGRQSYPTYLQVVEELASAWLAVGLGVSVHTLTCFPLATTGTPEQQERC